MTVTEAERLIRLEERYAHLQQHVAAQDKAMLELNDELVRLRKDLAVLQALRPPAGGPEESTGEDRPPHY